MRHDLFADSGGIHPIDIVESLAAHRAWAFDRLADDQIAMTVEGRWRHYSLTLAWSARESVLRLICTFDFDAPQARLPVVYEALNLINDQVWDGGFTFWAAQRLLVWRYGLVLAGEVLAAPEQIDHMLVTAAAACERFYPAFQLAAWGDGPAAQALDIAMTEAYGRA